MRGVGRSSHLRYFAGLRRVVASMQISAIPAHRYGAEQLKAELTRKEI